MKNCYDCPLCGFKIFAMNQIPGIWVCGSCGTIYTSGGIEIIHKRHLEREREEFLRDNPAMAEMVKLGLAGAN